MDKHYRPAAAGFGLSRRAALGCGLLALGLALLWPTSDSPAQTGSITVNAGQTVTSTIGSGRGDNHANVTVDGTVSVTGNQNAISLGDNAQVTVNGLVQGNAPGNGGGNFGSGPNVIETNSFGTITINAGGKVQQLGRTTNGEAINVHGYGNTVINKGTIYSAHGAALWFQDVSVSNDPAQRNRVENSGLISTGLGASANVFGSSRGTSGPGLVFVNKTGGVVDGSLLFGNGDDSLTFEPNSSVTGNIDGGGGTNDLTLQSSGLLGGILPGAVKNFSTLSKTGDGGWVVAGPLTGFEAGVHVREGVLSLWGENTGFRGFVDIAAGATLDARPISLPTLHVGPGGADVVNNGTLNFDTTEALSGTYTGNVSGTGKVQKSGAGGVALLPDKANTYSGGTEILEGTLGIAADSALGASSGAVTLGSNFGTPTTGTLQFLSDLSMAANRQVTLAAGSAGVLDTLEHTVHMPNRVGGSGTLYKNGAGLLIMTNNNDYTGDTYLNAGTLEVDGQLSGTNNIYVFQTGQLQGVGRVGSGSSQVHNAGVVAPGNAADRFGDLTLNGNYRADSPSATVEINSVLGDDSSPTSRLRINGDANGYIPTWVRVVNNGGRGALTNLGIEIIDIQGASPGDAFRLASDFHTSDGTPAVVGGIYTYTMAQQGGNWYLRTIRDAKGNPPLNPAIPIYESYGLILGAYNTLPTLEQRVGHRYWLNNFAGADGESLTREAEQGGFWLRLEGEHNKFDTNLDSGKSRYDTDIARMTLGLDTPLLKTDNGSSLVGGLNFSLAWGKADIHSSTGGGEIETDSEGYGVTLTWYDQSGLYADLQYRYSQFQSDLKSDIITSSSHLVRKNDADGHAASLEIGYAIGLDETLSLIPQAQLTYSRVSFDSFTDPMNNEIIHEDPAVGLEGRFGLALAHERSYRNTAGKTSRNKLYGIVDYYHEFTGENSVSVAEVDFEGKYYTDDWIGLSLGGSHNWSDDRFSVYGEVGARTSPDDDFGDQYGLRGEVGFRVAF